MVQVDVFWSYGIGAGFAVAASRRLAEARARGERDLLANPYFAKSVLYLATLFAPSGAWLLWAFPSWETMHAGDRNLPAWLVALFAATNVTQGALGFWATERLLAAGRRGLALLQPALGYFLLFFILIHGWDGRGYRRFFSVSREDFLAWSPGNVLAWLHSDTALTLYGMGLVLLPVMIGMQLRWFAGDAPRLERARALRLGLAAMAGVPFAAALGASLLVHALGWALGATVFAAGAALALRLAGARAVAAFTPAGAAA